MNLYSKLLDERPTLPNDTGWIDRHMAAVAAPTGFEKGVVGMLRAWLKYADIHHSRYGVTIGTDGVLGPEWESIGDALRGLLNGDCGCLDCGTLDGVILTAMKQNHIETADK